MPTGKIVTRSTTEVMEAFEPVYQPIFGLFLAKSQSYSEQVGEVNFRGVKTIGDIRAKHILPKDTEIKQVQVGEHSKIFKKYFMGNQFQRSSLQDADGDQQVVNEVLDEHNRQADDLLFLGEGTSDSTMLNNGLFWSNDVNYSLQGSSALASTSDHLPALYASIIAAKIATQNVPGRKVLFLYGSTTISKINALWATTNLSFRATLQDALGANWSIVELPSDIALTGNGFIVVSMDQVKLHYTTMPKLEDSDYDRKNKLYWWNFLMGSMMLEALTSKAIYRQPLTYS